MDAATKKLLEHLRAKPRSFDRDELIRATERLRFHDFKSLDPAPKTLLVLRLTRAGYEDLAKLARAGEYDQDELEANAWAESPEGRAAFAELKGRNPR